MTGVKLAAEGLKDFSLSVLRNKTVRDGSANSLLTCEDMDEVVCILVDDGGFLIISNQDNDTFTVRAQHSTGVMVVVKICVLLA